MYSPGEIALNLKSVSPPGTASLAALPPPGPVTAWKSTEWSCVLAAAFLKWTTTVSLTRMRKNGPGTVALNVQYTNVVPGSISATTSLASKYRSTIVGVVRVSGGGRCVAFFAMFETSTGLAGPGPADDAPTMNWPSIVARCPGIVQ